MPEALFVEHKGARILLVDFTDSGDNQRILETAEEAIRIVASTDQPRSVRALIDLSGTSLNKVVRGTLKRMSRNNGRYMKSVAFVGLPAVLSPAVKGFLRVSGRSNHRVFRSREEALNWLAQT